MVSYRNLSKNPFAQYSAEEDLEHLKSIYFEPRYYRELRDNAINGSSRILVGQRGLGKSATIHFLFEDLISKSTMPLLITRYDGIPLQENENYFLYKILQVLVNGITKQLFKNSKKRKKLNDSQRKQLAYFIELFYDSQFAQEYYEKAREIRKKKRWYCILSWYNKSLKILNIILDGVSRFGSDIVRRSIGLDSQEIQDAVREYFKEAKLPKIQSAPMEIIAKWDKEQLKQMLDCMLEIANQIGFDSVVILFDKIDEFKDVNSDVDKVANFAKDILQDTELLYTKKLSIVFSLWSEVKKTLNRQNVRFDKFKDINIEWKTDDLERLINKRLLYYSVDKRNPVTLSSLIPNESDRQLVLKLADSSPRSLIRLLAELYYHETGEDIVSFSPTAISKGLLDFCLKFDYCSLQTENTKRKADYFSWLQKVLQIRREHFTYSDVCNAFNIKESTACKYVNDMIRLNLVKEDIMPDINGDKIFTVVDPRLVFLISRGVLELK